MGLLEWEGLRLHCRERKRKWKKTVWHFFKFYSLYKNGVFCLNEMGRFGRDSRVSKWVIRPSSCIWVFICLLLWFSSKCCFCLFYFVLINLYTNNWLACYIFILFYLLFTNVFTCVNSYRKLELKRKKQEKFISWNIFLLV